MSRGFLRERELSQYKNALWDTTFFSLKSYFKAFISYVPCVCVSFEVFYLPKRNMDVFDYECGPKCQSKQHATDLNSVITRYSLPEIQAYFQLCHSAGHLADLGGQTPLHVAVSCGKFDVVEWLVKDKKVDVNAVDTESGWTALHKAIFYGQIKIARFLIQNSAHLCSLDHDGIQPLELLLRERTTFLTFSHKDSNDVFMWGENRNSTLGHSSEQRRQIPTAVDTFRRQKLSIKKVLLRKYHTVFLTQCGQVYTCGHGQGGRLGLGNENTYLIPQRVEALKPEICIEIAASVNHTAVLTKRGNVYTFGLNNHQQLAQISQSMKCLSPKWIKSLKGQKIKHVCVSQYHSVFCTQDAVFAVGFNGGQLGFPKAEQYQVVLRSAPLLEQNLFDSKKGRLIIDLIACSDAATVCLTTSLDIFVLHEYQCRKIMPSWSTVSKIDVIGGNLDLGSEVCSSPTSSADKSSCLTTGSSQLVIMVLSRKGQVYIWRSLNSILKCCIFTTRHLYISDICLGDSSFAIVAIDGRAYTANWKNTKVIKGKVPTEEEEEEGENPFIPHSKKKDIEKEGIEVYRIPFIHRASSIAINKEGNDFAVTQVTPTLRLDINYHENISHMAADFTRLMNMDLYDLQIKFGHQTWPAHQYIVAHHSNFFKKILIEASKNETTSDLVISVGYIHSDLIKQLFQFFYTDTCDLVTPGASFLWTKKEKKCIDFDYFSHPSCKDFSILAELNYFGPRSKDDDPISLLISIADKFEIRRLTNKLRKVKIHQGVVDHKGIKLDIPRVAFDHQKLPELSDLSIYSNDGSKFKCHRCVLIARSEYFTCMLTNDWLEASSSEGVKLPFSANSVEVLLEYLYTNEIPSLLEKKTLDLVCEVLVMANQILLIELKDLSEKEIISFINLRNVIDLLEFALLYDACHLKEMCLQVICHNMAYMLESRHLDVLDDEIMMELTMSYRKLIKDMSYRIVTPSSSGPDEAYLKSLVAYLQSNKQTNLKPNSGCKQKLNKRRPRVKTKSVSEDIEPNKSPQMNDVVDESYSVLTAESIPEKQLDESPLQKINHLPKTKRDKNNPWNMLTSPVRAQDSTEKHSPENSFLVGKVVNLADIMAEQNTLSQPVNNYLQGGSRYKKLSRKSVPKTPPVLETKSVQPLNNPWIKNLKQENICPQPNLSDIVQDELQKMKDIDRIQKKPFEYIQIEEKAIEELISLYSMNISFEENITINRETLRREQPVWGRRKNLLL